MKRLLRQIQPPGASRKYEVLSASILSARIVLVMHLELILEGTNVTGTLRP